MRLIDADAAIENCEKYSRTIDPESKEYSKVMWIIGFLKELPSAQPELYGYKIEHLALIARVMEKEGVSPKKAVETFANICGIVQMVFDEQKEIIKKAVKEWT